MDDNTNMGELRAYLAKTRGERYPLQGHRLAQENDYIKNLYLKHLGTVAHAGKSIEEPQQLFLQRLAAGCDAEEKWDAYLRQGGAATPESLEELFTQLAEKELKTTFLLDAMLLLHLGGEDNERLDFLAELCEAMRLGTKEAEYAAELCVGILKQDAEACLTAEPEITRWLPYLSDEAPPACKDDGTCLSAAAFKTGGDSVDLGQLGKSRTLVPADMASTVEKNYTGAECIAFPTRNKVVFSNLQISVDKHMLFSAWEVEFANCTFLGNGKELSEAASLWFHNCAHITIRGCKFKNFGGRVMYVRSCDDVVIENSEFIDCVVQYRYGNDDWREFGAIVRDNNVNGITALFLRRTQFVNCGGINQTNFYVSSVLSNCRTSVFDCVFQQCRHRFVPTGVSGKFPGAETPDPERNQRCLFAHIAEQSGNQITDSAELGPH